MAETKEASEARTHPDDMHKGNLERTDPSRVPADRDEALEEVRRVRAVNEERTRRRSSVEVVREIAAYTTSGNEKTIDFATADGKLYMNTHGEAVLDADGIVNLLHGIQAAHQAVS